MLDNIKLIYRKFLNDIKPYWSRICNVYIPRLHLFINENKDFLQTNKIFIVKAAIPCLVIVLLFYSCSSSRRAVTHNITTIFEIAESARTYYSNKPDYWGLSTDILVNNNVIPAQNLQDKNIVLEDSIHVLLGEGYLAAPVSPRMLTFDIVIPNLNKAKCMAYAEAELSEQQLLVLDKLTIYNDEGNAVYTWGGENTLPVVRYSSKNFCINGANTLIWSLK